MAPTLYATQPINVGGTLYEAGDEIKCGKGARESLLRFRQASESKPGQPRTARSDDDPPEIPEPQKGDTSIEVLELEPAPAKAAAKYFQTVEQIESYSAEHPLSGLQGIGEPTETKILAAIAAYRGSDGE